MQKHYQESSDHSMSVVYNLYYSIVIPLQFIVASLTLAPCSYMLRLLNFAVAIDTDRQCQ